MLRSFSVLACLAASLSGCGETPKEFVQMGKDLLEGKVTEPNECRSDSPTGEMLRNYEQRKSF